MRNRTRRGAALIVCLAVIVLLTVLVLALFSQARFHRKIEASGAARARAEILARSGLDYVVSRLIREIADPANSEEINGAFKPVSSEKMRPAVQLKRAASNLRLIHVPALIKQSIADFDPLASTVNTADPDRAGNFVGPKRWNAPMFYYSTPQFTAAAQAPDWIYLSADGATQHAPVAGRVAFNVYETDGLLDLGVAGYPSTVVDSAEIDSLKASTAGANVAMITRYGRYLDQTLTDIRSAGSSGRGEFVENALENTDGFLDPAPGDTQFVSRLDLIRYGLTNKFDNNALAFVTAWSRSLDAPSWDPPVPTAANQFAPAVKRASDVTVTDYFLDGTTREQTWKAGDPVAARRFPLNRIRWFDEPPGGARSKAIAQYFALVPAGDGTWRYAEDHIRTLSELRTADREPNFFEMLKAAIESGSLGEDGDSQLLRIGTSIIDAGTEGNVPTAVGFTRGGVTRLVCGVKDLPYLQGVRFREIVKTDEQGRVERVDLFALPLLVNPYANSGSNSRPRVRLRLVGGIESASATIGGRDVPLASRYFAAEDTAPRTIPVDASGFRTLSPIEGAPELMPPDFEGSHAAFWLATGKAEGTLNEGTSPRGRAGFRNFNLVLEYSNGGAWIPYDELIGDGRNAFPMDFAGVASAHPSNAEFDGEGITYLAKLDPRTTRGGPVLGTTRNEPAVASNSQPALPLRPFHTVAEIGCVFRDEADRTLDFAAMETGRSPDAALLDYFSINESGPDGVVAGRIGLNTSLGDVLAAQISGTLLTSGGATVDSLGKSKLYQMADEAISAILQSPADLVGRFSPSADGSKEKTEAPVRALGTAGQTRTWNLFIDLIAQSGKLPPGSDDLADFFSEGECRLWMHVAIDRFTGEVIDSRIEAYQE